MNFIVQIPSKAIIMKLQVWLYDIEEEKEMRGGFYL
jgi:hypothetical protein